MFLVLLFFSLIYIPTPSFRFYDFRPLSILSGFLVLTGDPQAKRLKLKSFSKIYGRCLLAKLTIIDGKGVMDLQGLT